MSKRRAPNDPDMLPEYDFSKGVRGKYYQRFMRSTNVVVLDPDVAEAFPNSEAVNGALRVLVAVARWAKPIHRVGSTRKRPNGPKRAQARRS
jgi:hypothetical protein